MVRTTLAHPPTPLHLRRHRGGNPRNHDASTTAGRSAFTTNKSDECTKTIRNNLKKQKPGLHQSSWPCETQTRCPQLALFLPREGFLPESPGECRHIIHPQALIESRLSSKLDTEIEPRCCSTLRNRRTDSPRQWQGTSWVRNGTSSPCTSTDSPC